MSENVNVVRDTLNLLFKFLTQLGDGIRNTDQAIRESISEPERVFSKLLDIDKEVQKRKEGIIKFIIDNQKKFERRPSKLHQTLLKQFLFTKPKIGWDFPDVLMESPASGDKTSYGAVHYCFKCHDPDWLLSFYFGDVTENTSEDVFTKKGVVFLKVDWEKGNKLNLSSQLKYNFSLKSILLFDFIKMEEIEKNDVLKNIKENYEKFLNALQTINAELDGFIKDKVAGYKELLKNKVSYKYSNKAEVIQIPFYWAVFRMIAIFWMGGALRKNIGLTLEEVKTQTIPRQETLVNLAASIIGRITRVPMFLILFALLEIILITYQVILSNRQNNLIIEQNNRIVQQNYLTEANRRSSLVLLISNIEDRISEELNKPENKDRKLSKALVARIVALCNSLKPYQYLEGDSLSLEMSPERGQLLLSLANMDLDTDETLKEIYTRADFSYADLRNANLSNRYLANINLSHAYLKGTDLGGAHLIQANLEGADLRRADLGGDLGGANLSSARLGGSDLRWARLFQANLGGADLRGADLRWSGLQGVHLSNADLRGADLRGADMGGVNMGGADLGWADLREAELSGAFLEGVFLEGAKFTIYGYYSKLLNDDKGYNLQGIKLYEISDDFINRVPYIDTLAKEDELGERYFVVKKFVRKNNE